jgi:hypothetical protein
MSWVYKDKNGDEWIYELEPHVEIDGTVIPAWDGPDHCYLPEGSIKKLIGKELTWKNKPVEL